MSLFEPAKPRELLEIFAKYANVEIPTKTVPFQVRFNQHVYREEQPTNSGVTILKEISDIAKENNINLRLWQPNSMGTMDVQHGRLNIRIKTDSNGKWRVENTCTYG